MTLNTALNQLQDFVEKCRDEGETDMRVVIARIRWIRATAEKEEATVDEFPQRFPYGQDPNK